MWDRLWINGHIATMDTARDGAYGALDAAAVAAHDGHIAYLGPAAGLPGAAGDLAREVIDLDGRWLTPGLIDCHTHIVYAGNRAAEFEQRLAGETYAEIAAAGGGILSTVRHTRAASEIDLVEAASPRLTALLAEGVTTVEIKSGYGLRTEDELKMLNAARALSERFPVTVRTTLLGAHAVPPEYAGDRKGYIDLVCSEMIPAAAETGLADAVDAFCEGIGFDPAETERVFEAAEAAGLPVKLHADQLSALGGAGLAARFSALSADHLEYATEDDIRAMAAAETAAVLLPGAFYCLNETRVPPIELFRRHGVPMAIATDCNPGTSPVTSILLMLNMACTLFGLTPAEALAGATRNAARALGLGATHGVLAEGRVADFALYDIAEPAELAYAMGHRPCTGVVKAGEPV